MKGKLVKHSARSKVDFWHDLPQKAKDLINEAKKELDKGEGISHEEVMAEIKYRFKLSWYT